MKRNEWKFGYAAASLAAAADERAAHHRTRLAYWRGKREEVLGRIRSEGIEIEEKLVLEHNSLKPRDWDRANRVTVRDDLRQQLDEVLGKLRFHAEQVQQYEGWGAVLEANPEQRLDLDIEDWLFFFHQA